MVPHRSIDGVPTHASLWRLATCMQQRYAEAPGHGLHCSSLRFRPRFAGSMITSMPDCNRIAIASIDSSGRLSVTQGGCWKCRATNEAIFRLHKHERFRSWGLGGGAHHPPVEGLRWRSIDSLAAPHHTHFEQAGGQRHGPLPHRELFAGVKMVCMKSSL